MYDRNRESLTPSIADSEMSDSSQETTVAEYAWFRSSQTTSVLTPSQYLRDAPGRALLNHRPASPTPWQYHWGFWWVPSAIVSTAHGEVDANVQPVRADVAAPVCASGRVEVLAGWSSSALAAP